MPAPARYRPIVDVLLDEHEASTLLVPRDEAMARELAVMRHRGELPHPPAPLHGRQLRADDLLDQRVPTSAISRARSSRRRSSVPVGLPLSFKSLTGRDLDVWARPADDGEAALIIEPTVTDSMPSGWSSCQVQACKKPSC